MRLVSVLYLMYQIDREKELLFVSLSMEKEKQETCVSALSDVSNTQKERAPLCFSFYGERKTRDLCLCSI